jgi:hypothetical protein
MWRARFGRGFGPVVRQTTKWMNLSAKRTLFEKLTVPGLVKIFPTSVELKKTPWAKRMCPEFILSVSYRCFAFQAFYFLRSDVERLMWRRRASACSWPSVSIWNYLSDFDEIRYSSSWQNLSSKDILCDSHILLKALMNLYLQCSRIVNDFLEIWHRRSLKYRLAFLSFITILAGKAIICWMP